MTKKGREGANFKNISIYYRFAFVKIMIIKTYEIIMNT